MAEKNRSCLCTCFLWISLLLIFIAVIAVIAGALFYAIYHPHRPIFTISSLQISSFHLTSTQLNSKLNFILTVHNPNKKITFFYDPFKVSLHSDGVDVGDGTVNGFEHGTKSTNTLQTVLTGSGNGDLSKLRYDLRKIKSLALKIVLDSKVQVKIGSGKTKKIGMRVICNGAGLSIAGGKPAVTLNNVRCKVGLRFKIWKWTV